jgi:hypothetical protein
VTTDFHPEKPSPRSDPLTVVAAVLLGSLLPIIAIATWGFGLILLLVAPIVLLAGARSRPFRGAVLWGEVAVSGVGGIWAWLLW